MHCSTKSTRSLQICGKLHEFLPDWEKILGPSQHLQFTQWMTTIDVKEKYDAINIRIEGKQPSTTKASAKNIPSSQQQQFQREQATSSSEQGQRQSTSYKTFQPGLHNPKNSAGFYGEFFSDSQNNDAIT
ncbi:hypothetical protein O181_002589 [Austropuccinia psidii MF-1]|uniref:Uncharacterized protein n=1 Tax=Austropuccinia psidii MF-1 TaxID=1389203 RepID=A0A9Q3BCQ4_9BASI|nr:hypothetical protein [Austropuccinia psidii MF-1]